MTGVRIEYDFNCCCGFKTECHTEKARKIVMRLHNKNCIHKDKPQTDIHTEKVVNHKYTNGHRGYEKTKN